VTSVPDTVFTTVVKVVNTSDSGTAVLTMIVVNVPDTDVSKVI